jgi:(p)ppGpp synthase/HD superfamily hydrolase
MWQLARLRQKLPTELPKTGFADIEALLVKSGSEELNPAVKKAYSMAESAHAGMTRQDGTPYIHHPARVCAFLISECGVKDVEVLQAALLHDVVEDTSVTVSDIEAQFGRRTAEYVDWLPSLRPTVSTLKSNSTHIRQTALLGLRERFA